MAKKRGAGEGSIYQRESDGLWVSVVNLGWIDGKRRRKYVYGKTRKEVADKLTANLGKQQQGLPVETTKITVEQYLTDWLENEVRPNREFGTYQRYEVISRLHIIPDLGKHHLTRLTPQHIRQFLARKEAAGISPSLRYSIRQVLTNALNRAVKWELVSRNVAILVDPPKVVRKEPQPWTKEQAMKFLATAKQHRLSALFSVALAIGLRKGEALGLTWEDVDLERNVLHVRFQLCRVKGQGLIRKALKTTRSRRSIGLPPPTVEALKAHLRQRDEDRLLAGSRWQETGFVFTARHGGPLEMGSVDKIYTRLIEQSGVPYRNFHAQRHWCATLLLAQGVPPRTVMGILGHTNINMTMDRYGHVLEDSYRDAADIMGRVFDATDEEEKS